MPSDSFVQALVDLAEEEGSEALIVQMRNDALAKIGAGGGEVAILTSATVNGKSGEQQPVMDATELFEACQAALRRYRGQEVRLTYCDFSRLS
ncbi:MAG TPA: hypothetical protein VF614_17000 [Chthoniobacteraceae bacterium]